MFIYSLFLRIWMQNLALSAFVGNHLLGWKQQKNELSKCSILNLVAIKNAKHQADINCWSNVSTQHRCSCAWSSARLPNCEAIYSCCCCCWVFLFLFCLFCFVLFFFFFLFLKCFLSTLMLKLIAIDNSGNSAVDISKFVYLGCSLWIWK